MKYKFIVLALLLQTSVFSQDYKLYNLFNNQFQALFPASPSIQEIPENLITSDYLLKSIPPEYIKNLSQKKINELLADTIKQIKDSQPYTYTDQLKQISYNSQVRSSGLEHENYQWIQIKDTLDKLLQDLLKSDNRTIISFSSSLDKHNDTYVAIYTSSYYQDEQKVYSSTKHIYHKDKIYKWTMSYLDKSVKSIFDKYHHNVKVIK